MNVLLFVGLLGTVFGVALFFGGAPERWTGSMFLAAALASHLLYRAPTHRYYAIEGAVALVDLALLTGIAIVLLKADRFWPIAMFAAHGVTVLAHLVKWVDPSIVRRAYVIAIAVPGYATLVILLIAVWRHRRRVKRNGGDPDWSMAPTVEP